jgi:hypothetical protein
LHFSFYIISSNYETKKCGIQFHISNTLLVHSSMRCYICVEYRLHK